MLDAAVLLLLIGEVALLARLDRASYGTWITPFTVLAVPYTIVVLLAYLVAPSLGFLSLVVESVWVWIAGLLLFWIATSPVALLFGPRIKAAAAVAGPLRYEEESGTPALALAWVVILVLGYALRASLRTLGWQTLGSDEFGDVYGYGPSGHVSCFSMGLAVFLIGTGKRSSRLLWGTVVVLSAFYLLYPTKSWVIVPVLAGLLYRMASGRTGLSLRWAVLTPVIVYGLFVLAYMIAFGVVDPQVVLDPQVHGFLATHFLSYIFAGVLAFGNVMHVGLDRFIAAPVVMIAPIHNLVAVVVHAPLVTNVTENFSVISQAGAESNVNTYFGTILMNLGYGLGMVYVVCSGVVASGLFALARITRNCWVTVAWVFTAALLSLGWFEFYFANLQSLELPTYLLILAFLTWLARRRSRPVGGLAAA